MDPTKDLAGQPPLVLAITALAILAWALLKLVNQQVEKRRTDDDDKWSTRLGRYIDQRAEHKVGNLLNPISVRVGYNEKQLEILRESVADVRERLAAIEAREGEQHRE